MINKSFVFIKVKLIKKSSRYKNGDFLIFS